MKLKEQDEVMKYYDEFKHAAAETYPVGIRTSFNIPYDQWVYVVLEKSLLQNAMSGCGLSVLFAMIILVITTGNYVVSLYSTLSISIVIATLMGAMKLQGWTLGVVECIGLIIFVGFSVDYVVHMCHQYVESIHTDR